MFQISDNGIGISDDQVNQLFRPFFQANPSPSRRYGGTGLGLAISYHLCKLMQGDIQVQSELGKGTCFTIYLPLMMPETAVLAKNFGSSGIYGVDSP
jgi:signal transduction histidine kinase